MANELPPLRGHSQSVRRCDQRGVEPLHERFRAWSQRPRERKGRGKKACTYDNPAPPPTRASAPRSAGQRAHVPPIFRASAPVGPCQHAGGVISTASVPKSVGQRARLPFLVRASAPTGVSSMASAPLGSAVQPARAQGTRASEPALPRDVVSPEKRLEKATATEQSRKRSEHNGSHSGSNESAAPAPAASRPAGTSEQLPHGVDVLESAQRKALEIFGSVHVVTRMRKVFGPSVVRGESRGLELALASKDKSTFFFPIGSKKNKSKKRGHILSMPSRNSSRFPSPVFLPDDSGEVAANQLLRSSSAYYAVDVHERVYAPSFRPLYADCNEPTKRNNTQLFRPGSDPYNASLLPRFYSKIPKRPQDASVIFSGIRPLNRQEYRHSYSFEVKGEATEFHCARSHTRDIITLQMSTPFKLLCLWAAQAYVDNTFQRSQKRARASLSYIPDKRAAQLPYTETTGPHGEDTMLCCQRSPFDPIHRVHVSRVKGHFVDIPPTKGNELTPLKARVWVPSCMRPGMCLQRVWVSPAARTPSDLAGSAEKRPNCPALSQTWAELKRNKVKEKRGPLRRGSQGRKGAGCKTRGNQVIPFPANRTPDPGVLTPPAARGDEQTRPWKERTCLLVRNNTWAKRAGRVASATHGEVSVRANPVVRLDSGHRKDFYNELSRKSSERHFAPRRCFNDHRVEEMAVVRRMGLKY
ncbi:hypothetical protein FB451DRAFT_1435779 [Mycena latifolia]|nr:hypothetical protein FB451DRAFT_1435779 [Mycena latifolia]